MLIRIMSYHGESKEINLKLQEANCCIQQEFTIHDDRNIMGYGWQDVGVMIGRIYATGLNVMLQHTTANGEPIAILWVDNGRFQQR